MSHVVEELKAELRSLTMKQLEKVTGIEPCRIYQMIKKGQAPPNFKVGKTYRFPIAGVKKWFADQTGMIPALSLSGDAVLEGGRGKQYQSGFYSNVLREECNNITGTWYGAEFANWIK